MTIRKCITTATVASLFALGAVTVSGPAFSQAPADTPQPRHTAAEIEKSTPTATFELQAEQIRLILGGSQGKGTLFYQGKQYPFTMKGGSVGGVGVTKVNATGNVYFLNNVDDFAGTYSAISAGGALGAGAGVSQFENNKGVYLAVKSKTEGLALNMGLGAVQISLQK
jgi:hypothetical protein